MFVLDCYTISTNQCINEYFEIPNRGYFVGEEAIPNVFEKSIPLKAQDLFLQDNEVKLWQKKVRFAKA